MEDFIVIIDEHQSQPEIESKVQSLGYKRDEFFNTSSTAKVLYCYDDGTYDVYDSTMFLSYEQIKTIDDL